MGVKTKREVILIYYAVITITASNVSSPPKKERNEAPEPLKLKVPGYKDAAYYEPLRRKRKNPIFLYLHSKNGRPFIDCKLWYRAGIEYGWVVCPSGIKVRENGYLSWDNNPFEAERVIKATINALSNKYKGKVLLKKGILAGFSEGAFIALQVGLKMNDIFPYLFIIGADTQYIGYNDTQKLKTLNKKIKIYLITGEKDPVVQRTKEVEKILKKLKINTKLKIIKDVGHEIPKDITQFTRNSIRWFTKGPTSNKKGSKKE